MCDSSIFILLIYVWMPQQTDPHYGFSDHHFSPEPAHTHLNTDIRWLALTLTRFKMCLYVSILTGSDG